jgi:hypothetical protein
MVAFNFSPEHAPKVESGEKLQTIRETKRGYVGDRTQLYTGQRTPACRKLRQDDPPLTHVTPCHIRPEGFVVGNTAGVPRDNDPFARADGFKDYADMLAWFQKKYGRESFSGYLHIWAAKQNENKGESPHGRN